MGPAAAGGLVGPLWFIGWLFTLAFAKLVWWQIIFGVAAARRRALYPKGNKGTRVGRRSTGVIQVPFLRNRHDSVMSMLSAPPRPDCLLSRAST